MNIYLTKLGILYFKLQLQVFFGALNFPCSHISWFYSTSYSVDDRIKTNNSENDSGADANILIIRNNFVSF